MQGEEDDSESRGKRPATKGRGGWGDGGAATREISTSLCNYINCKAERVTDRQTDRQTERQGDMERQREQYQGRCVGQDVALATKTALPRFGDAAELPAMDPRDGIGLQRHDEESGPVRRGRDAVAR